MIEPDKLFSDEILNYQVKTEKLGVVDYVNLDNAATTPPFLNVQKETNNYLASYGSVHRGSGTKSKVSTDEYEKSRDVVKKFVNAPKDDYVIFSGNTTGGINIAAHFFSFLAGKIMVSTIEHSSSWLPWIKAEGIKLLGEKQNKLSEMTEINNKIQNLGRAQVLQYDANEKFEFNLNNIENILKQNQIKALVLTASSNVTGYCPPIEEIGKIVHKYGAYFVVDACQFLQHHKIDMREMEIDFLVASGHKFYAPYGGGFLIGPKKFLDEFLPYQIGGGNLPYITEDGEFIRYKNQMAHDPGTPNAIGAVAMMYAVRELEKLGLENIEKYEKKLTKKLFRYLKSNPRIELYVSGEHLSTILPFNVRGQSGIEIAEKLNSEYGIGVRAGSFCAYQMIRNLLCIDNETDIIESVKCGNSDKIPAMIRVSISICNTEKDIDRLIFALSEITK